MDTKFFYGRGKGSKAVVPLDPEESDIEDSDEDLDDPDYVPRHTGDTVEELPIPELSGPDTHSDSTPRRNVAKNQLVQVADQDSVTPKSAEKRKLWRKVDITSVKFPEPIPPEIIKVQTPLFYFSMLFTDEMVHHIYEQTNLYSAQQLGFPIKTIPKEIQEFLVILLYTGVFPFPSLEDYWKPESRFALVADIMPLRRFRALRRFIHFADNSDCGNTIGRFYKIRPIFDMLRRQCLLLPADQKQSIDEVMVAYKGTRAGNLRQYISSKPDKWGFKLFCRASSTGIVHDFILYQGKTSFFNVPQSEAEQSMLMGEKVVTTLCRTVEEPESTVVFCDNFFTSFNLVQLLEATTGIKCLGTVRNNRMSGAENHLKSDKQLSKEGRGAFDYCCSGGIVAVKWRDNKCVTLLSNACGVEPVGEVTRYSKERDCRMLQEKPMPLKRFRTTVARTLEGIHKTPARVGRPLSSSPPPERPPQKRKRDAAPVDDVRYDSFGHWPACGPQRGRCKLCPKGVSRWKCAKCGVFLCLNSTQQCFVTYHLK
ncbi:piggyBac transposable element-derived protein 3-like [Anguilla anguilla]|uniref:piggyBac transposable element-derived protein 3-like n=1 Tax=Anguilla anguilla TaxID=7936 RepID=UPI0015AD5485|nr:piggyBac transposable element-derived protein 3-like [Anguilla anguilla]